MQFLPTLFLKAITILIGIGALAFLLVEPHFEGRNMNATLFEIYFTDPFLAYAYIASIPFFIALYQAFQLLGSVGRGETLSHHAVKALRTIRHCALAIIGFVVPGMIFIRFFSGSDDPAGGIAMGALIILGSLIAAATASTLERVAQRGR
ncbi:MAG: DUF2975 domain-containing protein [Candidatus Paceibacterota bacterium]|nr:MAG: DUF2975 domain-containing protein [Candidatus Paceibacterota bacterium]